MSGVQHVEIKPDETDQRLDRFLRRRFPQLTQGRIEKMCRKGELRLDGGRVKTSTRVQTGQSLRVPPLGEASVQKPSKLRPMMSEDDIKMIQNLVIYRDPDILVLNKPSGLAVQGGTGTKRHIDGMTEALKFNSEEKPRLVHRLDRDTSGVLLLARSRLVANKLAKSFAGRSVEKVYWALAAGVPSTGQGTIRYGLVKSGGEFETMKTLHPDEVSSVKDAKSAQTDYLLMDQAGSRLSWIAMAPRTGRTHQLRAHSAAIGHPILGDHKYGARHGENRGDGWGASIGGAVENRLHLHARSLRFAHPKDGRPFFIAANLPPHMESAFDMFGFEKGREADIKWENETHG